MIQLLWLVALILLLISPPTAAALAIGILSVGLVCSCIAAYSEHAEEERYRKQRALRAKKRPLAKTSTHV